MTYRTHARHDASLLSTGWQVFVEEFSVTVSVGIRDFEYCSPQVVLIDAVIDYDNTPDESILVDYDTWCSTIETSLANAPHIRLLENLLIQIAATTFDQWPNVAGIRVCAHKPHIRPGVRKVGVSLNWNYSSYLRWMQDLELASPDEVGVVAKSARGRA